MLNSFRVTLFCTSYIIVCTFVSSKQVMCVVGKATTDAYHHNIFVVICRRCRWSGMLRFSTAWTAGIFLLIRFLHWV